MAIRQRRLRLWADPPSEDFSIDRLAEIIDYFSSETHISYISESCYAGNVLMSALSRVRPLGAKVCGMTALLDRSRLNEKNMLTSLEHAEATQRDLRSARNESDSVWIRFARLNRIQFNSGSTLSSENFAIQWARDRGHFAFLTKDFHIDEIKKLVAMAKGPTPPAYRRERELGDSAIDPILRATAAHLFPKNEEEAYQGLKGVPEFEALLEDLPEILSREIGEEQRLIGSLSLERTLMVRAATHVFLSAAPPQEIQIYRDLQDCEGFNFLGPRTGTP